VKTSDQGIAALVQHEGVVPGPYLDSEGYWTYGVGHAETSGLAPNPKYMRRGAPLKLGPELEKIFALLRSDLKVYEKAVNQAIKVKVSQHEFDAAVSFHYNTGAIGRASWVKKLNAGDRKGAARAIMSWKKPASIIDRRKAEQKLFRTGTYPKGRAPVYSVTAEGRVIWKPIRTLSQTEILGLMNKPKPADKPQPTPEPTPFEKEKTALNKANGAATFGAGAAVATATAVWWAEIKATACAALWFCGG